MKKILLASLLALCLASCDGTRFEPGPSVRRDTVETPVSDTPAVRKPRTCRYGQCTATAKSTNKQCGNCAQAGSTACHSHRPK